MSEEFCVVCGRTGRPLVEGICADCAADRIPLITVPRHAEVTVCPTCGARLTGRRWTRSGSPGVLVAEDLAPFLSVHPEAAVRTVRWTETSATATVRTLVGTAQVRFRGVEREVELPLEVRLLRHTCPDCSRKSGRYYTAVVQLRGPTERRTEKAPALRSRLDAIWTVLLRDARSEWRRALSWREPLPEGWDCFFTDTLSARAVVRLARQRYGVRPTESATLFGRKDGQDVYRVTFCLRFPADAAVVVPGARSGARARHVEQ